MKQIVRYRFMTIPYKMYADIRITIDDSSRAEVSSTYNGGKSTNIILLPMINIQILRPKEVDGNGGRFRPTSANDSIGLTKFNFPTFINELKAINEDMKTPDLFVYRGDRLDLNDKVAEKVRRAFIIGRTSIEMRAVVIEQNGDSGVQRIEGIKLKFNNEDSTVLLTLREVESMIWIMDHTDIDGLVFKMYTDFIERNVREYQKPVVDIQPLSRPVYSQVEPVTTNPIPVAYTPIPEVPMEAPKKEEPIKQETIISAPPAKYSFVNVDEGTEGEPVVDFMNPPES